MMPLQSPLGCLLRLGADISVSKEPGSERVFSTRDDLAASLDAAAGRELDALIVFVYCKPLGVEVARATLGAP